MTREDLKFAFIKSVPIMFSYIMIGIAYGILMNQAGFNAFWPFLISLTVYTGAFQFVLVPFLASGADLATVVITCAALGSRQLFYGVSFIEQFKKMGKRYLYMVFSVTDETYGIYTSTEFPEKVNKENSMFAIAIMCHSYWIIGSVLGAVIGMLIPFSLDGIDFAMTSLFTTMFIDQWRQVKDHKPAIIGAISSIAFLIILGPAKFMLPSLVFTTGLLIFLNAKGGKENDN